METTVSRLLTAGGKIAGALAYRRTDGAIHLYRAPAVLLATGGGGRIYRITSNSWECTGDGTALAYEAGAELQDCEMVQFHPTGMVWPPGVRGILVTEGVRGEGGVLKNSQGERFMQHYDAERMELSSRDVVARAINSEVLAGRGSPHGGAFLDITHRSPAYIKSKLPSMYEQFLKLARVDITKEPMEVAPTIHYFMGGVRVEAGTGATAIEGLYAAGEVTSGLHGANRLGGNSLTDLLVFGKRAGEAAARRAGSVGRPEIEPEQVEHAIEHLLDPLNRPHGESPYDLVAELQDLCTRHAPIIRDGPALVAGLESLLVLKTRAARAGAGGPNGRAFNPGWHTALDLEHMLVNAEALLRCAIAREESRGAHTRSDFPDLDPALAEINFVAARHGSGMAVKPVRREPVPAQLAELIEHHYPKYRPEEIE
jgi:succinate dehydrogenase / fumarate reductase flavoprotein subunit